MNRVKRELRKRGIKLESDYPWMPYFIKGESIFDRGYIFVDGVSVDSEKAKVRIYYNTIKYDALEYLVETYKERTR